MKPRKLRFLDETLSGRLVPRTAIDFELRMEETIAMMKKPMLSTNKYFQNWGESRSDAVFTKPTSSLKPGSCGGDNVFMKIQGRASKTVRTAMLIRIGLFL